MYFIKDINNLVKNSYHNLDDFIDPISLKEGSNLTKSILAKLWDLKDLSIGVEKTIINILIKDWLYFVYFGCLSKIYENKMGKDLKSYDFRYIPQNIDFFHNYRPSRYKSIKRTAYRFCKQFINTKSILVKNLNHRKIVELNRNNEVFTNINSSTIENHIDNNHKVYYLHFSDIFQQYKYFHNIKDCKFTRKVTNFICKNFKLNKAYNENSYGYFFLSIKYVKYYFKYIMSNPSLIPKKLLIHNQKNIMDRIIINAMKERKGKVTHFDHGGGSFHYNSVLNIAWTVKGNFYKLNGIDEFVTYSNKIVNLYKKIIPSNKNIKFSVFRNKIKQDLFKYNEDKVFILDYPIDLGRPKIPPFISEISRIRLMNKLIDLLKNKDLEIFIKGHPDFLKETSVPNFILNKYKIKRIDENFENLKEIPRNVIVTYPGTTLLHKLMLMNFNIIFADLGHEYQKEYKKFLDERTNIVKCEVKPRFIKIDEKKLTNSFKAKKICNKKILTIFN